MFLIVEATYPLFVFYGRDNTARNPWLLEQRHADSIWDETSFVFEHTLGVYLSYLKLKNTSIEFRSNIAPFFGSSLHCSYDANDDTVNIYNSPDIPNYHADFFDRLRKGETDDDSDKCDAFLFHRHRENGNTGAVDRFYGCAFGNGTSAELYLMLFQINFVPIEGPGVTPENCLQSCDNNMECKPSLLRFFPSLQYASFYGYCTPGPGPDDDDNSRKAVYFPPIYLSLPQGTRQAPEIYYKLGDVRLDKMISLRLDPVEEHHYIGSLVTVWCNISESFAATPIRFALKYKGVQDYDFLPVDDDNIFDVKLYSRSASYKIGLERDMERIFCFAPLRGSFGWINASLPIQAVDKSWVETKLVTASENNTFVFNGRRHELPVLNVSSIHKTQILQIGTSLKIPAFSESTLSNDEETLLRILVAATFPFYVFYDTSRRDVHLNSFQTRSAADIWNEASFLFEYTFDINLSNLKSTHISLEFRSNFPPFFGCSFLCSYNAHDDTVNIYNRPDIPHYHAAFFDGLRKGENDGDQCDAFLFHQLRENPYTGGLDRLYGCSFADGTLAELALIPLIMNSVQIDRRRVAHENCIQSCEDHKECKQSDLFTYSSRQSSRYGYCTMGLNDESSFETAKRVYFSPIYVSLPQGTKPTPEIYYKREDVELDKMISLDPIEEYHHIGSSVTVRCNVSEAFAATPFRFALKYSASQDLNFLPTWENITFSSDLWSRSTNYTFKLGRLDIERIFCFAPLLGSFGWINASLPIQVSEPKPPLFLHDPNLKSEKIPKTRVKTFSMHKSFALGSRNKSLNCYATGDPSPEITWTWNGVNVRESNGEYKPHAVTRSQLLFSQIYKTTEGEYICTATNTQGVAHATIKVVVTDDSDTTSLALPISVPVVALVLIAAVTATILIFKQRSSGKVLTDQEYQDFLHGNSIQNSSDPNPNILSKAFDPQFIINRPNIEFDVDSVLGSGQYGVVMKGWLQNSQNGKTEVAVKTTKKNVDIMYVKALISEVKIMAYVGDHRNVVGFLGACIENLMQGELFVVVEFCNNGDLLGCLRKEKASLKKPLTFTEETNLKEENTLVHELPPNLLIKLVQWSRDISSGMAFIGSKNVIHGDLAARNVLLDANSVAKISDFGLSRQLLNDYTVYTKQTAAPLPWKWMAVESLTSSNFSLKSDAWAFGITLWEIFSLGNSPYPGCNYDEEFVQKLSTGFCPSKPKFASDEWYEIMQSCWNWNPHSRPEMSEILEQITEQQLSVASSKNYAEINQTSYTIIK